MLNTANEIILPKLLDQKQLAIYLGKSTAWCERSRWAGSGPKFIKLGRHVRYKIEDVAHWVEEQTLRSSSSEVGK